MDHSGADWWPKRVSLARGLIVVVIADWRAFARGKRRSDASCSESHRSSDVASISDAIDDDGERRRRDSAASRSTQFAYAAVPFRKASGAAFPRRA